MQTTPKGGFFVKERILTNALDLLMIQCLEGHVKGDGSCNVMVCIRMQMYHISLKEGRSCVYRFK